MNAAQRQLLLFGSLMTVLLAPYFNPLLDSLSQGVKVFETKLDSAPEVVNRKDGMRIFCPRTSIKKPFVIVVYVRFSERARHVTLVLPDGLTLVPGQQAEQWVVPTGADGYAQLAWKVLASKFGEYDVRAEARDLITATQRIRVGEPLW
jgi:hypothetical protein